MISPAELDRLDALATAATPGPWEADNWETTVQAGDQIVCVATTANRRHDSPFIAAARTAVPMLTAAVRELQAENERLLKTKVNLDLVADSFNATVAEERDELKRKCRNLESDASQLRAEVERLRAMCDGFLSEFVSSDWFDDGLALKNGAYRRMYDQLRAEHRQSTAPAAAGE